MNKIALSLFLSVALCACGKSPHPPATPSVGALSTSAKARTRYAFNNQCFAVLANGNGRYVVANSGGYAASAVRAEDAEAFYLKPSALGKYLIYGHDEQLMAAAATVVPLALAKANDTAEWTLKGVGDTTVYAPAPIVNVDPDAAQVVAYRNFVDPNGVYEAFTWSSDSTGKRLAIDSSGKLITAAVDGAVTSFSMTPLAAERCAPFPEAQDNVVGETFKGTQPDGRVLGYADSHLHATSTTFLGGAKPGWPFHKFGVTHALADCSAEHGQKGERDVIGALFTSDTDGHDTHGWPTFPEWPSRTATTHEATYWKWIERAWKSGLRLIVNYAVDNQTLCEIERNAAGTPTRNCNEMVNAGQQIGTAYAMQDYIDGQYGGRGAGWYRIVLNPAAARAVMAQGKVAVLLGVEVSNLVNCSVTYNPASTQQALEETGDLASGGQTYGCAMTETGAPNEILTQLQRLKLLGVSGLFTIHEFDNAFGGNDIFEGLVLNLGTKENSGGLPSAERVAAQAQVPFPAQAAAIGHLQANGVASGEYWSTYDCPSVDAPEVGGSYIFPVNGVVMTNLGPPPPLCPYTGRGGHPGGKTACYPSVPQCNARLLTPIGRYAFSKIMDLGFIFEIDHLAYELKNQLLDLSEAQTPKYPTISAHGFSGLSAQQARRIFAGGGLVYPSLNDVRDYVSLWQHIKPLWKDAGQPYPFAFGFGSDTNGLSPQSTPRATIAPGKEVTYPFTLFKGPVFDTLPEFAKIAPLRFDQPAARDARGNGRSWHVDIDGNAHYGMAADSVQELRIEGTPEQMRDLYNSAEVYVQYWERTNAASAAIRNKGIIIPNGLLRAAPATH